MLRLPKKMTVCLPDNAEDAVRYAAGELCRWLSEAGVQASEDAEPGTLPPHARDSNAACAGAVPSWANIFAGVLVRYGVSRIATMRRLSARL